MLGLPEWRWSLKGNGKGVERRPLNTRLYSNGEGVSMLRKQMREHIFRLLFQVEFISSAEMPERIALYLSHLDGANDEKKRYMRERCLLAINHVEEIDALINEKVSGWRTGRMNKVDLTILRLAVFEIKYDEDIPTGVAINEAVELAKKYSGDDAPAFVNGVLAKVITATEGEE